MGGFIRCSVRDLGRKSYNLMFPEGKGLAEGWKFLSEKLRQLGVRSSEEAQREEKLEKPRREEKLEKPRREEKQRKTSTKSQPKLLKKTPSSFVEILKTKKISMGGGVYVEVGEEEVWKRLDQLDRCLVGWWGKGSSQILEVDSVRRWAISQWNTNEPSAVVKMGRGLWLFEFESKKEVVRVLMYGRRRYGANLVHLRKWGQDLGCCSYRNSEEKGESSRTSSAFVESENSGKNWRCLWWFFSSR